jgi:phosphatidylinositol-bisphosphatase
VIWLGDLNYRVDLGYLDIKELLDVPPDVPIRSEAYNLDVPIESDTNSVDSPPRLPSRRSISPSRITRFINIASINSLLLSDQLSKQRELGNVFNGFNECQVTFQPSYKFDIGTGIYDTSEKRRAPSWCDRILWKGDDIVGEGYCARMEFCMSDHKPVQCLLRVNAFTVDVEKKAVVEEEISRNLDIFENAAVPDLRIVSDIAVELGIKGIRQVRECRFTVENFGIVPAKWEFISKGDMGICKAWVNVGKGRGVVPAGEKCDLVVMVEIDGVSAANFNFGRDTFEDILVLHGINHV